MTLLTEAREAVYLRFVSNWTLTPYVFDNEGSDSLDGDSVAWARLSVREVGGGQRTLGRVGNRRYRRQAIVFVQLFTPIDAGVLAAGTLAQAVRTIFEGVSFGDLDFNDVRVREATPDEKWHQTIVEAVFDFEETK